MESKELNDELFQEKVSLLSMNNLSYELPSALSVVAQKNKVQNFFQPSSFTGASSSSQGLVIFNQGAAFVNGDKSYLNLTVKVNKNAVADLAYWSFGQNTLSNSGGSCQNLITQVLIQSRGGEQIVQNLYHNIYSATTMPWKHNRDGYTMIELLGGANKDGNFPVFPVDKEISFMIPLNYISDWFATASLINPQAMAGAKMLITFANISDAILGWQADGVTAVALGAATYNISNLTVSLDVSDLYDSCNALIQSSANNLSSSGLQTAFKTYYAALFAPNGDTVSLDLNISAAKISNLFVRFIPKDKTDPVAGASIKQLTSTNNGTDPITDGFNTLNSASWQTRLGSQQIPLYPVTTALETYKQVIDGMCSWKNAGVRDVDALGTLNKPDSVPITYYDFYGAGDLAVPDASGTGCFGICVDYEKSNAVGVSGIASNNSKLISLQLNKWRNLANYNVFVFVELMCVLNSTSQNNVLDR